MPAERPDPAALLRRLGEDTTGFDDPSHDYHNGHEETELPPDFSTWASVSPTAPDMGWPILPPAALHGLAGDIVRALDPTTEADPVAVLMTFLAMFGNAAGRGPYVPVGDERHGANLFVGLVGATGSGRKGASQAGPLRLMRLAQAEWASDRVAGGLSSGEGLIWAIRDAREEPDRTTGETKTVDAGVEDKRLLCIEEEFAAVLKVASRKGNTITEQIRRAWDSRETIRIMTKGSPVRATKPHVSLIAHVTRTELTRNTSDTDAGNGFLNRFAWFRVRKSKDLPSPEPMPAADADLLATRIASALSFALTVGEVRRDGEAEELWRNAYPRLNADTPGLAGAMSARGAPIVVRLSLVYALLGRSPVITRLHLEAALAVWSCSLASVRSIFGELTGDTLADRIGGLLHGGPLSRTALIDALGRNVSATRLDQAIEILMHAGRVETLIEPDRDGSKGGRRRTFYRSPAITSAESKQARSLRTNPESGPGEGVTSVISYPNQSPEGKSADPDDD